MPTISDLHADAVTELTDRRHAVTVVQQAYGEVLGAHRQRMVLVGHVEALRNEPEALRNEPGRRDGRSDPCRRKSRDQKS